LIAGLEQPTQGAIRIADQTVTTLPPKQRDVAMVFQHYALYPHMSVYENMALGLKLRHFPKTEIDRRVKEVAELLDLSGYLQRKPEALSGGERQRVALGRAMMRRPRVFLLDEPLSNLDAPMRLELRAEIAKLHSRVGATMLYVTHDQVEAMTLGQRVAVMRQGVIQQVASPLEVYARPANQFVASFVGSPPMNFFTGTVICRNARVMFEVSAIKTSTSQNGFTLHVEEPFASALNSHISKSLILGIRPEHITPAPVSPDARLDSTLEAVVELVQPLGGETLLWLGSAGHSIVARVQGHSKVTTGEKIRVAFDLANRHFFDPVSQKRIEG
jgi:multiple sugar transport system ATP-binding protein